MKTFDWKITIAIVGMVVIAALSTCAKADYYLVMYDLKGWDRQGDPPVIYYERFVSYSDCRKRGERNQSFARYFDGRVGFTCPRVEEI